MVAASGPPYRRDVLPPRPPRPGRAPLALALLALLLALALGACGGEDEGAEATSSTPSGGPFPVRIAHKYGATVVPAAPTRVVAIGYTDQEPLLALGIRPVGVVDWFQERPYGTWPWTDHLWGDARPAIVGMRDDIGMERVADLRPDLILALYTGITESQYRLLSAIAPTVAQPPGHADFAAPWRDMTLIAARAVGKEAEAAGLIAGVERRFAAARREHPELAGRSVAVAERGGGAGYGFFGARDPKLQFLEGLGMVVDEDVRALQPGGNVGELSPERLGLLDTDLLVFLTGPDESSRAAIEGDPLFQRLAVARERRTAFLPYDEPPIGAALSFNSVLSIPYALDQALPRLAAAAGGG